MCAVRPYENSLIFAFRLIPGVLTVNFTPLAIECQYRVTLLVNSSINNKKDCAKHNFYRPHIAEKEVHSVERTVCVSPQYSNATNTGYAIASRNVTCQVKTISSIIDYFWTPISNSVFIFYGLINILFSL